MQVKLGQKNLTSWLNTPRNTTKQKQGQEVISFNIFASTGGATNLQQFDLTTFKYTASGSALVVNYVDDVTGEEIKYPVSYLGEAGTDITIDLTIAGYTKVRSNAKTAKGIVSGDTVKLVQGAQIATYTYKKVDKDLLRTSLEEQDTTNNDVKYKNADKSKKDAYDKAIENAKTVYKNQMQRKTK